MRNESPRGDCEFNVLDIFRKYIRVCFWYDFMYYKILCKTLLIKSAIMAMIIF
jgi:hypothetical protein